MATATRKSAAKSKVAAAKAAPKGKTAKSAATKATTTDGPSKRELAKARDAELTTQIVASRDAGEKWGEIASAHSITPGKAQFLYMLHCVAEGDVPSIKHRNETELVNGIRKARDAHDTYSSWGWIAARTGVSEGKIKALATEAGMDVAGSNVAVRRAEANGSSKKSDSKTATQAGRAKSAKGTASASKAAKAKATAKNRRAAKGTPDPS